MNSMILQYLLNRYVPLGWTFQQDEVSKRWIATHDFLNIALELDNLNEVEPAIVDSLHALAKSYRKHS